MNNIYIILVCLFVKCYILVFLYEYVLVGKATKAMYEVLKKGRVHNLSIKCQYDLFDKMVNPVLLYECEIWGFGNNDIIQRVHLKFCKHLLN